MGYNAFRTQDARNAWITIVPGTDPQASFPYQQADGFCICIDWHSAGCAKYRFSKRFRLPASREYWNSNVSGDS